VVNVLRPSGAVVRRAAPYGLLLEERKAKRSRRSWSLRPFRSSSGMMEVVRARSSLILDLGTAVFSREESVRVR
jgi:hypothetical protein